MSPPVSVGAQPASRRRAAWDRTLLAHRRYTGQYGDALASGVAYATLLGGVPAAVLLSAAVPDPVDRLGDGLRVLLPATVGDLAVGLPLESLPLRAVLLVALVWSSLRLVRASRTSARAMCQQRAGSGNPVRDLAVDLRLGGALGALALTAVTAVSLAFAAGGQLLAVPAAVLVWTGALTLLPRLLTQPLPGRPAWAATVRPALVGAVLLVAVTALADGYVQLTEQVHEDLYRDAGVLVGVAVWVSVSARIVLRTFAWAATAGDEPT